MGLTAFEEECIAMIDRLERINLRKAELRLEAARRAVERAREEIQAFRTTIEVHRSLRESDIAAPPQEPAP